MLGDIAAVLHFQLSEMERLPLTEVFRWHEQAIRVVKAMGGK